MRVSKRKVNQTLQKELFGTFYQMVADLKNPREVETVLTDLLGKNELTGLVKRLSVAYWLSKGRSTTNIKENLAVSPATVEVIKRELHKSKGLQLAIKKVSADEWATRWTTKIRRIVK